jgi:hypothetical protein
MADAEAPVLQEGDVEALAAGANQFVPWVPSLQTNMTAIATYLGDARTANGVVAGVADPLIYNRAVHQGAFIAAGLAQFVANSGVNVMDDGSMSLATFVTDLTNAIAGGATSIPNSRLANMPAGTVKSALVAGPPVDATYAQLLAAMGVVIPTQAHFQNQGGAESIAPAAWGTRVLNYADAANNIAGASVAGNQVSLPAGRYKVSAMAVLQCAAGTVAWSHKIRVRNMTAGATVAVGLNNAWSVGGTNECVLQAFAQGVFVLAATSSVEVDSYVTNATGSVPGTNVSMGSGEPEVYVDVLFEKVG